MGNDLFKSADLKGVRNAMAECVRDLGWLAVVGPVGVGKSTSVRAALGEMRGVRVVEPVALDRERVRIGHILEAAIDDLCDNERPRQSMEARSRQWRRIVGTAGQRERIVLLIEEAHRLHRSTLVALKGVREIGWAGRCPIVAVVLVGQVDLEARLRRTREVRLRVKRHTMSGLTKSEVGDYVTKHLGYKVAPVALKEIALRCREPLGVADVCSQARDWADARRHPGITVEDVRSALGIEHNVGERIKRSGLPMQEVARRAGVSKSAVSAVANGTYAGRTAMVDRIAEVLEQEEGGTAKAKRQTA